MPQWSGIEPAKGVLVDLRVSLDLADLCGTRSQLGLLNYSTRMP